MASPITSHLSSPLLSSSLRIDVRVGKCERMLANPVNRSNPLYCRLPLEYSLKLIDYIMLRREVGQTSNDEWIGEHRLVE